MANNQLLENLVRLSSCTQKYMDEESIEKGEKCMKKVWGIMSLANPVFYLRPGRTTRPLMTGESLSILSHSYFSTIL